VSNPITISKFELIDLFAEVDARARAKYVSTTITDIQLTEMLGNPSKKTVDRFIKSHNLSYAKVGDRKIFKRAQVERIITSLIDNPLKVA
jgi:hypothetical protein